MRKIFSIAHKAVGDLHDEMHLSQAGCHAWVPIGCLGGTTANGVMRLCRAFAQHILYAHVHWKLAFSGRCFGWDWDGVLGTIQGLTHSEARVSCVGLSITVFTRLSSVKARSPRRHG